MNGYGSVATSMVGEAVQHYKGNDPYSYDPEKAKELLDQNPEETVQKVAAAVGYEDAYHFSKVFKKYYGISPLYYKGRAKI